MSAAVARVGHASLVVMLHHGWRGAAMPAAPVRLFAKSSGNPFTSSRRSGVGRQSSSGLLGVYRGRTARPASRLPARTERLPRIGPRTARRGLAWICAAVSSACVRCWRSDVSITRGSSMTSGCAIDASNLRSVVAVSDRPAAGCMQARNSGVSIGHEPIATASRARYLYK
jgi:hypothetical protein